MHFVYNMAKEYLRGGTENIQMKPKAQWFVLLAAILLMGCVPQEKTNQKDVSENIQTVTDNNTSEENIDPSSETDAVTTATAESEPRSTKNPAKKPQIKSQTDTQTSDAEASSAQEQQ